MDYLNKFMHFCNKGGIWLSGVTLFAMMVLTASDVCGRYLFKHPIYGVNDLTELLMVVIIFLGLSNTEASNGNIQVEFFTSRLTAKSQRRLKITTLLLSEMVALVLTWRLIANASYVIVYPENTLVLEIPKLPFIVIAAVGCGLLTLVLFVKILETMKEQRKTSST